MGASLAERVARHLKIHYMVPKMNMKAELATSKTFAHGMGSGFSAEIIADIIAVEKGWERRREGPKPGRFED